MSVVLEKDPPKLDLINPIPNRLVDVVRHELHLLCGWQVKEIERCRKSSVQHLLANSMIDDLVLYMVQGRPCKVRQ